MGHTYIDILDNTLESMMADADDNGKETIQPVLTSGDIKIILSGLRALKPCTTGAEAYVSPYKETVDGMLSANYKERFKAEYLQTKIRYEKLKAFNNRIEASNMRNGLDMPIHDCPDHLLVSQQRAMGEYLHILEVRAVIEGIEL